MEVAERRKAIMIILCKRRFETVSNLAYEFNVNERTIRRDINALSLREPIYTRQGRYDGGVYIIDNYYTNFLYFNDEQIKVLNKLVYWLETNNTGNFSSKEISILKNLISDHTKPTIKEVR